MNKIHYIPGVDTRVCESESDEDEDDFELPLKRQKINHSEGSKLIGEDDCSHLKLLSCQTSVSTMFKAKSKCSYTTESSIK